MRAPAPPAAAAGGAAQPATGAPVGLGGQSAAAGAGSAGAAAAAAAGAAVAVPLRRDEFADLMVACAAAAGVTSPQHVGEYLRVFYLLHLSDVRAAAGVPMV